MISLRILPTTVYSDIFAPETRLMLCIYILLDKVNISGYDTCIYKIKIIYIERPANQHFGESVYEENYKK